MAAGAPEPGRRAAAEQSSCWPAAPAAVLACWLACPPACRPVGQDLCGAQLGHKGFVEGPGEYPLRLQGEGHKVGPRDAHYHVAPVVHLAAVLALPRRSLGGPAAAVCGRAISAPPVVPIFLWRVREPPSALTSAPAGAARAEAAPCRPLPRRHRAAGARGTRPLSARRSLPASAHQLQGAPKG